jgi:diadenosine tetraphosphate (Ap4A) HIT family hydrolase
VIVRRVLLEKKDADQYIEERVTAPCFICEIVAGTARRRVHEILYEDERTMAFFSAYPTHYGQTLVCPKRHVVDVVGGMELDEYLDLQRVVHTVARAVERVVQPERIYIASFGSHQLNAHVHFHIHPLPAGVPVREQQMVSMIAEIVGRLELTHEEWEELGTRVRAEIGASS